jgi:lipopolysaccharide/colanic/teichoic acid biosynthesis glycosyltransferase
MLLEIGKTQGTGQAKVAPKDIFCALSAYTRETDVKGWYDNDETIGVIFTEIGDVPRKQVLQALSTKVRRAFQETLGSPEIEDSNLSFHVYPDELALPEPTEPPMNTPLFKDLEQNDSENRLQLGLKRAFDVAGSLLGVLLCAPVLLAIAILIKLTSKGPILFRQKRIGQCGRPFTFLKFRSMHFNNDHTIHRTYVTDFISAGKKEQGRSNRPTTYKLTRDPRVTAVGRLLRRTSLDELPQLFNVLKGDMSLVGPRPPISYELAAYEPWHKNRVFVVKPGITGLWQVAGRSRVTFDEMVRLDLRYAASWSLWLDLNILLRTPKAVISGQGAH